MQTESMTRLLRKDADSPSGFEIVGFEWHINGSLYQGDAPDKCFFDIYEDANGEYIIHDAFEQGIKIDNGEWWFEGDIGLESGRDFTLEIVDMYWRLVFDCSNAVGASIQRLRFCQRFGTIHDRNNK